MKRGLRQISILLLAVITVFLAGCAVNGPEGLPAPAGSDAAIAGRGFATGTYDREYQLYNMFYADGSVISYLVENGNWNYLGQLNVGAEVGRGTSTLAVLSRREGNTPGSRLRLNSDCSEYNLEFDDTGNYWITSSAGAVDRFAVPLNTGQPIRQIAGTNDAITIHTTSSGVAWFTLHCDLSGGQPAPPAAVCGNNIVETGEVCDGSSLAGQSCNTQGFTGGTLSCATNCLSFNTNLCTTNLCGNNVVETGEVCDGTNLAGQSCSTQGFTQGTLSCIGDCRSFNINLCVTNSFCGDGRVSSGEEQCDDGNMINGDGCSSGCRRETYNPSMCGDGVAFNFEDNRQEECDGSDLRNLDCTNLGFRGGNLGCSSACRYETSNCDSTNRLVAFSQSSTMVYCEESDGGINPNSPSDVIIFNRYSVPTKFSDYCPQSDSLLEYSCVRNGEDVIFNGDFVECSGGVCENGACVSSPRGICGNGLIERGEQCDDGNTAFFDGCTPGCIIDSGWSCSGPSVDRQGKTISRYPRLGKGKSAQSDL